MFIYLVFEMNWACARLGNYPFLPIFLTAFLSCQLQRDSETPPPAPVSESKEKHDCCKDNDCPSTESGASPSVPSKNATTAKELRDLMYRHYCVGKGKLKKPYYSDVNFKTNYIKYIKIPDVRTFLDKSCPVRTRKRSGMSKNNPGMVRSPLSLRKCRNT